LKDFEFERKDKAEPRKTETVIMENQLKDSSNSKNRAPETKNETERKKGQDKRSPDEFELSNPTKQINKVDLNPKNNRNPFGDELVKGFKGEKDGKKDNQHEQLDDPFGDFEFEKVDNLNKGKEKQKASDLEKK
jgi:hypothetical protein